MTLSLEQPAAEPLASEQAVLAARGRATGLVTAAGATIVMPTWSAFDYILEPRLVGTFAVLRLACFVPMAALLYVLYARPLGLRHPGAVTTAVLAIVQLEVGWMIPQVEHLEFYLLGGSLLLYASGAVLATRPQWTAVLATVIWVGIGLGQLTTAGSLNAESWLAASIFLGTAAIIGVFSHLVRYRSQRTEILARLALEQEQRHTRRLLAQLHQLSTEDPLTGLANRRRWDQVLEAACARTGRPGGAVAVVLVDVDQLKAINDLNGHAGGDEVLRQIADVLRAGVRAGDLVARLGGDEMGILLPGVETARAVALAEQIRAAASELVPAVDRTEQVTLSLGVASSGNRTIGPDELTAEADIQLYLAKQTRNAVASADSQSLLTVRT